MIRRRAERGLSLAELLVVICVIAILASILAVKLIGLRALAEQAVMDQVIGAIRSAAAMEIAGQIARGRGSEVRQMAGSNPMDGLAQTPPNYLGVIDRPDPSAIPGGHWYFDGAQQLLIYRVRHEEYFRTELRGPARARFKFRVVYAESRPSGGFEAGEDLVQGLILRTVEPYSWGNP